MRAILASLFLILPAVARAGEAEDAAAQAAVAVELAKLSLKKQTRPKVDPEPALPTDPSQPAPPGYQWIKRGDGPWKLEPVTENKAAVPEVAGLGTFRNGGYNASHRCPTCGFQSPPGQGTWIVRGQNPDGTHTHVCPLDGTTWRH